MMGSTLEQRLDAVEEEARRDLRYQQLLQVNKILEKRFDQMVRRLPDEDRGIAWDYVMNCEDMSRRMLEIACRK